MTDSLREEKTHAHTMPKTRLALLQAPRHTAREDSGEFHALARVYIALAVRKRCLFHAEGGSRGLSEILTIPN